MLPVTQAIHGPSIYTSTPFCQKFIITPRTKVELAKCDPNETYGVKDEKDAIEKLHENGKELRKLHKVLNAQKLYAALVTLDGLDTSGKDGTIKDVYDHLLPQTMEVTSYKVPTEEEAGHDYLWRIHKNIPPKGMIGIFNRSHMEDVTAAKMKLDFSEDVLKLRYRQNNDFERMLFENNIILMKFFLNISKDENKKRLLNRLLKPDKTYKFSKKDLEVRKKWDEYIKLYEGALTNCNTEQAPCFIIPANNKWYRNFAVSEITKNILQSLKMEYPKPDFNPAEIQIE